MKQTNNAIKFLMAQYRAIFKNAYFKGLVSATVLTAAMAAGQANATNLDGGADSWDQITKDTNATVTGTNTTMSGALVYFNKIDIQDKAVFTLGKDTTNETSEGQFLNISGTITVNNGGQLIVKENAKLSGYDKNLTDGDKFSNAATGDLLVKSGGTLKIGAGEGELVGSEAYVQMHSVTLNSGSTTNISGNSSIKDWAESSTLLAGLGKDGKFTIDAGARVNISSFANLAVNENSSMNANGIIQFDTTSGTGSPFAFIRICDTFSGTEPTFDKDSKDASLTIGSKAQIYANGKSNAILAPNATLDSGAKLYVGYTVNPDSKGDPIASAVESNLTLNGDFISKGVSYSKAKAAAGLFTSKADIDISTSGSLIIGGGTYNSNNLETKDVDESKLVTTLDMQGGKLTGNGKVVVAGTLKIDEATLDGFIDNPATTATNGHIVLSGNANLNASKDISTLGALEIKNTSSAAPVDLHDYTFGENKGINVSGDGAIGIIKADHMAISDTLTNGEANAEAFSGNLHLYATDLTLGNANYNKSGSLGFQFAKARNLYVESANDLLSLANSVKLSATREVVRIDDNGNEYTVLESEVGDLNSLKLVTNGILTIDGGIYDTNEIALAGGILEVRNTKFNDANNEDFVSQVNVDTLTVDLSTQHTSTQEVDDTKVRSADVSGKNASLTIGSLNVISGSNPAKFVVSDSGVLNVDASDIQVLLDRLSDATLLAQKVYFTARDEGTLKLSGGLTFNYDATSISKTDGSSLVLDKIVHVNESGTLEADYLRINSKLDDNQDTLSKMGNYKLNDLELNATDASGTLLETIKLAAADSNSKILPVQYILNSSLSSTNKNLELLGGVAVKLGDIETIKDEAGNRLYDEATTEGGTVEVENLLITGATATHTSNSALVDVRAGEWTGRNIEVGTKGSMTVGALNNGEKFYSVDDKPITASFTGNRLAITGGKFTVNETGTAQFTELDTSAGGNVTVLGNMTVVGTDVLEDSTLEDGTPVNIAVKTSEGSITVGENNINSSVRGYLTFGNQAVTNSIFDSQDGTSITLKSGFTEGTFNVYNNSVVKLEFGSDKSFNGDELLSLKEKLFSTGSNGLLNIGDAKFTGLDDKFTGSEANNDLAIKWDYLKDFTFLENITSDKLAQAKVTGVNSDFRAHVGSIELASNSSAKIVGNSSLSNASGNNGKYISKANGEVADASIKYGSILDLNNGGEIGTVDIGENSALRTGQDPEITSETTIKSITGNGTFVAGATKTFVTGDVSVHEMYNTVDSYLEISGKLDTDDDVYTEGQLLVKGKANIKGDLDINAKAEFQSDLSAKNGADIYADTTVKGNVLLGGRSEIGDNALFKTEGAITLEKVNSSTTNKPLLFVGEEAGEEPDGTKWESSAGFVQAARLDLNGGTLIADPDYGKNASIAVFTTVGSEKAVDTTKGNVAGTLNGDIVVARNSVVALGLADNAEDGTVFEQLEKYLLPSFVDANGSLKKDEVGSILFIGKALNLQASDTALNDATNKSARLVLDSTKAGSDYLAVTDTANKLGKYDKDYTTKIATNNIYLGGNTVLAIDEGAIDQNNANRGAIHLEQKGASIYGDGGKIVLTGNSFNRRGTITLFSDDDNDGIMVDAKGQDIRVETLSGLFYYNLVAGETTTGFNLLFDRAKADLQFAGASAPVKHDLIAYATFDKTWDLNDNSATYAPTTVHGSLAEGVKYDAASGNFTDAAGKTLDKNKYVAIDGVAYHAAYNEFLERVVTENGNGQDGETAARFGIYGGTAQAALAAATTTSDAIAARAGMGGKSASLSVAENSQGASLWLAPIYKASNSDGFAAQGVNYGVDIDMYGLALGGDYSLGNGMKFGAMFNLGSGDADGNGAATNITNDFDYYGFGAYFGYSVDQFSILADVSYTIVDNDVSGTTTIDKLTASLDSKALSVGVSAQYEFDLGGVSFVPHAGARYTRLDLDSYDLKDNQIGDFAHSDSSDASIFSIPVGVTISKEIVSETWAVKPFVDFTLTANTGDDEIDSSMSWNGTNMVTGMKSEIFDSFTYGASAGVSAQSGNFSFGVSANYTGSSNVDEYGVSANARFVF